MTASARLEFRVRPDRKSRIERAAELVHEPTTTVPPDVFDNLLDALDAPPRPNAALARAAHDARTTVTHA